MFNTEDIHSLTDFKRNTAGFREKLRKSGQPFVLTVDGRPAVVVQDAAAYQRMLDALDRLETIEAIRDGLATMNSGKGRPAETVLAEIRRGIGKKAKRRA
ncbi:MAG: type II toxin-antitoxin system Phd/YefM family antitoxin [Phycisphaeraceae bacterium]|nr:type II toxin-antitoxin system Phd/YefM family antitoxin [Phycisphaeraceae bacterium]MCW5768476.1 type II toxin-antitoxin system Phd/YefM family antitoxin [Phycisphaeraceae bacterium]